ncbi:MAG: prepilin-type N-terminal cleavage/methylation domain-containing protein [bacterium]|nr:prepilin-type N-terminal cleavage/methylation domain-containing protein [bacterium]
MPKRTNGSSPGITFPVTQTGFTLVEVALAIVIGVVLLAGSAALYNQTKIAAGTSKAMEKRGALASLVDELQARILVFPSIAQLQVEWRNRRDDYLGNPWGGGLSGTTTGILGGDVLTDTQFGDVPSGVSGWDNASLPGGITVPASPDDAGKLIYLRGTDSRYFWVRDVTSLRTIRVRYYAVGIVGNRTESWLGATGSEASSATGTGKGDISGGVAN